ncbi:MAG: EamA family transporter [Halieaceae bacterium]|nr:EamA family transporter [Halieaceae bacterium]
MQTWVMFTLLAAFMQAIRTAGQKEIARHISPMTTTLVRYLFGLPFAVGYLLLVSSGRSRPLIQEAAGNMPFLVYASLAAVVQILASVALVKVLSRRNFVVGTSFAKTEAIQTALISTVFFGSFLSMFDWLAVILGVFGVVVMSFRGAGQRIDKSSFLYGIGAGTGFAITSLWLRQASLSLGYSLIENAAITLCYMVSMQTLICLLYTACVERGQLAGVTKQLPLAIFIGATSAFGSVGWFTAMSYENAALVKSLGQIEFVFTLSITSWFFKEKIVARETVGVAAIIFSILILLLLA